MSGVLPPGRAAPIISSAAPPVLIDFVSHVPAPVTRLLVEQAGTIKVLRRAAEIASWKSQKSSESWILLAVWWLVCASVYFGVRFLVPVLFISPVLWRHLKGQSWWPWHSTKPSHEPVVSSDTTVAATISDITSLRLLLPPFLFMPKPVQSRSPILDALRTSHNTLPVKSLLRVTAILYLPYLLVTFLVPLPIIFGITGTMLLTARAPWICVVRTHVAESGWARWIWRRVWAFLTGLPIAAPGSMFKLQEIPASGSGKSGLPKMATKAPSAAQKLQPAKLRFRFDILENQRWWVGIDWSSALLPNERTSWCSPPPHLTTLPPPTTFSLPAPTTHIDKALKIRRRAFWRWDDPEWTVLVKASHEAHSSRVNLSLPDVSSDSEGRLAKGLKRVGESLPDSAVGGTIGRKSLEGSGDDEQHETPGSPSALFKDPLTDSDGWVYADNKWEGPCPKGGLGKYTRYRIWSRCAVLIEEIEDLDEETTSTDEANKPISPTATFPPAAPSTHHHHQQGHKKSASEDGVSVDPGSGVVRRRESTGQSSSVSDRESRLTSRLKSVLEHRGTTK